MFTSDGNYLLSGARQDAELLCWDVRYAYDAVYRMQRDTATTNQRIQFDLEPCGRHLLTGGSNGCVQVGLAQWPHGPCASDMAIAWR